MPVLLKSALLVAGVSAVVTIALILVDRLVDNYYFKHVKKMIDEDNKGTE